MPRRVKSPKTKSQSALRVFISVASVLACLQIGCTGSFAPQPPGTVAAHTHGKIYYLADGALLEHEHRDGRKQFFLVEFIAKSYELTESGIRVTTDSSRLEIQRSTPDYLPIVTSPTSATRRPCDHAKLASLTGTFDESTTVQAIHALLPPIQ